MSETLRVQDDRAMFDTLRKAVDVELTVSQHYWARAVHWRNAGLKKLADYYAKEADEERGHAKLVADRMAFLGIEFGLQPEVEQPTGNDKIETHFVEDLAGEAAVADQYVGWVREAWEKKDHVTEEILRRILRETEEHADWLQGELRKVRAMGEGIYLATWEGR